MIEPKINTKHDSRVDLQNLNLRNARTSVDLRFNRFIFFESTLNSTKPQENGGYTWRIR